MVPSRIRMFHNVDGWQEPPQTVFIVVNNEVYTAR